MKQHPTSKGNGQTGVSTRVLYFIIILLMTLLVGMVLAWAQCVPGDLVCMTLD